MSFGGKLCINQLCMCALPQWPIYSNNNHVGWLTGSSDIILKADTLRMMLPNCSWNWSSCFKGKDY